MVTYQVLVAACKVAEVRRARAASQTAAFRLRQRALNCGLTLCASKVAIAVYVLSGHDAFVATRFMIQKLKLPTDHDTAEFATWVESKYLETLLDALVAYELPESDAERRIHTQACKFVSSFRTAIYVERTNLDQGVTPSGRQVAEEYIRHCDSLGALDAAVGIRRALDGQSSASSGARRIRKWGRKFRQLWGLGFGKLPVREPIPDEDVKDKAGWGFPGTDVRGRGAAQILRFLDVQNDLF